MVKTGNKTIKKMRTPDFKCAHFFYFLPPADIYPC